MTIPRLLLFAACCLFAFATPAAAWDGTGWGAGKDKTYADPGALRAGQAAAAEALRAKEMEDGRRGWVERTYHCREAAGTCPAPGASPRSDIEPSETGIVRNSVFTQELADQCASGQYNCRTWVAEQPGGVAAARIPGTKTAPCAMAVIWRDGVTTIDWACVDATAAKWTPDNKNSAASWAVALQAVRDGKAMPDNTAKP